MGSYCSCFDQEEDDESNYYNIQESDASKSCSKKMPSIIQEEESRINSETPFSFRNLSAFRPDFEFEDEIETKDLYKSSFQKKISFFNNLTQKAAKVTLVNHGTGLCLKSHVLRNQFLVKAYEVTLTSEDYDEYQDWIITSEVHEEQEVIKLEHAITRLRLCAIRSSKSGLIEVCCKREEQTDLSDLWKIEQYTNEAGKNTTYFHLFHYLTKTYLSFEQKKQQKRNSHHPRMISMADLSTIWKARVPKQYANNRGI